jgi:hypothetical protein
MKNGFNQLPLEIKLKIYELKGECFLTTPYRSPGDQFEFFAEFLGESKLFSPSRKTSWYQTGGIRTKVLLSKNTWKKELVLDGKKTNTKRRTWNQDDVRASWLFRWYDLHKRLQWRGKCAFALAIVPGYPGDGQSLYTLPNVSITFYHGSQLRYFDNFEDLPWVISRMEHFNEKSYEYETLKIFGSSEQIDTFEFFYDRYFDRVGMYTPDMYIYILKNSIDDKYIVNLDNTEFRLGKPNAHLYTKDNYLRYLRKIILTKTISDLKVKE